MIDKIGLGILVAISAAVIVPSTVLLWSLAIAVLQYGIKADCVLQQ